MPPLSQTGASTVPNQQVGQVVNVFDGDTISVSVDGTTFPIRYIGVDTPEQDEPCGAEATAFNAALVMGQVVRLVKDVSETDRYGRLLRYVYVGERLVNAELVTQGYAEAVAYPPDTAFAGELEAMEAQAREANRACHAAGAFSDAQVQASGTEIAPTIAPPVAPPTSPPPQAPTSPLVPTQPPVANCDPAYPDVCIGPKPPDLDCKDIPHRRFRVLPPDPHEFDSDGDGVGCES